jgi:hypothetical protein
MTGNYGKSHEEIHWNYAKRTLNVLDRAYIETLKPSNKVAQT